jgi:uncharacterized protein (TIGR04141 family)
VAGRLKTWTFTIFLLTEQIRTPQDALKGERLTHHRVRVNSESVADLFVRQAGTGAPKWAKLVEHRAEPPVQLTVTFASGVLFIEAAGRLFALTFGYGRFLLNPGSWEESFGLRVTLNSVDGKRLKSIDHKKFEAITRHSRTQTNREGSAIDFGIDVEQDLVRAVTGPPNDPRLGNRMTGMDALVVNVVAGLDDLPALLASFLERYRAIDYKKDFAWIDHIAEVRDPSLLQKLTDRLVENISRQTFDKLWLCIPEIVDWNMVSGFAYGRRNMKPEPDVHLRDFLNTLADPAAVTLEDLKKRSVIALDNDGTAERDAWPVFRCIYFECDLDASTFMLTNGKWYRISTDFLETVRTAVDGLARETPRLPAYTASDADEGTYNTRAAAESDGRLALMDRKFARIDGNPVEACDLYSADREFIHVKRYQGSSAPLSHLFAQGVNAGAVWLGDAYLPNWVKS